MTTQCWSFACKACGRPLEKEVMETPWHCWGCDWSTEDVSRNHRWDGVSQKPGEWTGEHL